MFNSADLWFHAVETALDARRQSGRLRSRRPIAALDSTHVQIAGKTVVNFASNDYLGLSHHPRVTVAFSTAAAKSAGSGAAGLVTGHTTDHASAEAKIAAWKSTESAVLLGSGFAANTAAVQAIAAAAGDRPVRFLVDKLVHASLIDAVKAVESKGVSFRVFPHNGMPKLRRLLTESPSDQLQVVVTESIFSMDGDAADLAGIAELKSEFPFLLLLDEAHGSGVYGPNGSGYAAELGLASLADLTVVTLSKAVGCVGGAVCGSGYWCDAVVNFGRPYVFSTSLPAAVAVAIGESIAVMQDEPQHQTRLRQSATDLRRALSTSGLVIPAGDSPIIPVVLGDEARTMETADRLLNAGFLVGAIRPPTVAPGASRLRITVSCGHTDEQLQSLSDTLKEMH